MAFTGLSGTRANLGALLAMAGWALVFRSSIGLLLTAAMCVPIIARIRAEEEFLVREFRRAISRLSTPHPLATFAIHLLTSVIGLPPPACLR
jgi:hypothetical protein